MIKISGLSFKYENAENFALQDINIEINKGEFIGIIGAAGAGKTTLTYCLNGVIPHFYQGDYYGKVLINDIDPIESSCAEISRVAGSVFQDPEAQIVSHNVEEEIAFGMENLRFSRVDMKKKIEECLSKVGLLKFINASTSRLSGGQKQRVAIASAIALSQNIIILDEPTSELDPQASIEIFRLLKELNEKENITVVVVEQKSTLLAEYCDKLIVLEKGNLAAIDTTRNIFENREMLERIGLNFSTIIELSYKLIDKGYSIDKIPLNIHEANNMIMDFLGESKN